MKNLRKAIVFALAAGLLVLGSGCSSPSSDDSTIQGAPRFFYVSSSDGDDTNDGTSQASPWDNFDVFWPQTGSPLIDRGTDVTFTQENADMMNSTADIIADMRAAGITADIPDNEDYASVPLDAGGGGCQGLFPPFA